MQRDPSRALIEFLDSGLTLMSSESRSQRALELIRSGADIHAVTDHHNKTCLHCAIPHCSVEVVQLLLERGIDANAQNWEGNTALHTTCDSEVAERQQSLLVPMLLYHGADPWIRNDRNLTPLDWIFKDRLQPFNRHNIGTRVVVATVEHLYYYMFDQYTESGLSAYVLLRAADLDLSIFKEIVETIKEVDWDNNLETTSDVGIKYILTMPSENLRLLLDKFDYVLVALFRLKQPRTHRRWCTEFRLENVYILVGSRLQREFIDWLCEWKLSHKFLKKIFANPAPLASREDIVYYLLSYGMEIHRGDVETVYKYCGYNDLFKFLRFMDVDSEPTSMLIPRLVFQVNGVIQQRIEDPRFWVNHLTERHCKLGFKDFKHVLPFYAIPNLKDLCCEVEMKGKERFFKKLHDQPRVPLLVEMARNVFRKYFVQRLGITSAKQFYRSLELLPISSDHRKIVALETELY